MKAKSCGLEILAIINHSEMQDLANNPLTGTLKYRDDDKTRDISFNIITNITQRNLIEVTQEPPEVYFGHATKTTFSINPQFYDTLTKTGYSEGRFYGIVGKLEIEVLP